MTSPIGSARTASADIPIERVGSQSGGSHTGFRLSWGAVFAGLVIATALQVVLTLLGSAIGLAAFDPGSTAKAFGIGAALWTVVTLLISLFIGGSSMGRLAGILARKDAFLHGVLLWSLSTLLTIWLVSRGIGAVTGTAFRLAGNVAGATAGAVASGAANAAGAVAGRVADNVGGGDTDLRGQLSQLLKQTGDPSLSADSLSATAKAAGSVATRGPADNGAAVSDIENLVKDKAKNIDRNDIVNIISARTGRSRAESEQIADRVTQAATDARSKLSSAAATVQERAPQVAENVASATSTGLWFALLGAGLSLAAAVLGARSTARE